MSTLRRGRAEPADYPPEQPAAALRWIRHSESIEMHADAAPLVAIGILMTHRLITRDQAFDLHGTASQHSRRKLRHIAEEIITTGDLAVTQEAIWTARGSLGTSSLLSRRPRDALCPYHLTG